MTPSIALLALILYLSPNYVYTYRLYNFGQNNGPRFHTFLKHQSLVNCVLSNNWSECPVVPRDIILKMLTNAHGRGAHHQSERILHRLFEIGHNQDRRAGPENIATPVVYPQLSKHLSWLPQRRTFSKNAFINPSYPTTATTASPINSKIPLIDTHILRWQTTLSTETSVKSDFKSAETISETITVGPANNTPLQDSTVTDVIADENFPSYNEESEATSVTPVPLSKPAKTTLLPINKTSLIYNVEIGLITRSEERTIKNYITINEFSEVPKHLNHTVDMVSTNHLSEVAEENNFTLSTAPQYRITFSNRTNHFITNLNSEEIESQKRKNLLKLYSIALDKLERKFYTITFNKLTSTSPVERRENGISFVQSGLFLSLQLMAFSTDTDAETKAEIDQCLGLNITDTDKIKIIEELISELPKSSFDLKWRWSSRLMLGAGQNVSEDFRCGAATALNLFLGQFSGNESGEILAKTLNKMIEKDSGGAIRNTFNSDELSEGVRAIALTTLYMRGRWRSAPTVLNGSRPFRDADGAPPRTVRMIRINDYVRYANFEDWNFQAIEIFYATRGLSLLMLVPNGRSLRELASHMETVSIAEITGRMITMRVAVSMPLYTLRMTLLLPSKLNALGVNKLISSKNATNSDQLKLSHAVQRLMFWAEAGRNAFKDDGIEWDAEPELEIVVDRPYLFFVRWHNITLMNGNFVL